MIFNKFLLYKIWIRCDIWYMFYGKSVFSLFMTKNEFLLYLYWKNRVIKLSFSLVQLNRSVVSDSLWPHELQHTRLLCPWESPGKNTGVGCHAFLRGIFPTQESNLCLPHLLHCRWVLYHWATEEAPNIYTFIKVKQKCSLKHLPWVFFFF